MSDKFLKYWRERSPKQKRAISEKIGVHYSYLSSIAHGKRQAGLHVLTKISRATGGKITMRDLRPDIYGK